MERYAGTCYKAAGWIEVGETSGRGRDDYYQDELRPKALWLKELEAGATQRLRDPFGPSFGEKARAHGAMPVTAPVAQSIAEAMAGVKDPRVRRGTPSTGMARWMYWPWLRGTHRLGHLPLRAGPAASPTARPRLPFLPAGRPMPPARGRLLARRAAPGASAEHRGGLPRLAPAARQRSRPCLAFDGKTLDEGLVTLVSLVDPRDGTALAQAACPGKGHENRLAHEILGAIPAGALDAKLLVGDALYADRTMLREIVQDHPGRELQVQLKDNQPNAVDRSDALLTQIDPPFST